MYDTRSTSRNIILFVNSIPKGTIESVRHYERIAGKTFRVALLRDTKKQLKDPKQREPVDIELPCDLNNSLKILQVLRPYQDDLLAATCRGEANIEYFRRVIPNVPYVRTPTLESLAWATDKLSMRERFFAYDRSITPLFTVVEQATKKNLDHIKKEIGFPLVLKPANLALSLLVSVCFHEEELERTLNTTLKKIERIYAENNRHTRPKILAEQFMEGEMYSIDVYVNSTGKIYFCPLVHVKTGRSIGFDDFFNYRQLTPTTLKKDTTQDAESVARKAVRALGLRSTTVHIELMKTDDGWKIIEAGARMGGFRQALYEHSFGIDHAMNDILVRMDKRPIIPKRKKGYTTVLKFFAKEEGYLTELRGIKKVQLLGSFIRLKINKSVGDRCTFAKRGGTSICDLTLFNPDRSKLLADIRRAETELSFGVE